MEQWMRLIWIGLSCLVSLGTFLPLLRQEHWWIRAFDFPRMQLTAIGVMAGAGLLWTTGGQALDIGLLALLGVSIAYQLFKIFPYTVLASRQVVDATSGEEASTFSVLISNVYMENRSVNRYVTLVAAHDPDIVLVAEPDNWWEEKLQVLENEYPYAIKCPKDNTYGMLLYSRLPLHDPQVRFLLDKEIPSVQTGIELPSGKVIDFYGLHPRPPRPGEDTAERDAELLVVGREVHKRGRPTIVAGDLNDVAWSHTTQLFQEISGLLDPRIGRGMYSTYNAHFPLLRYPLDHIFFSETFQLVRLKRLPGFGSDHFPIYVELQYNPKGAFKQEEPAADAGDRQEAEEKVEEGRQAAG